MATKTAKKITSDELAVLLAESSGATTISLIARTDARLRKKGNPYGTVYKVAQATGLLGADYENRVNNQLARENPKEAKVRPFVAGPRGWGENSGRLIDKDGLKYLNFSPNRVDVLRYETANGVEVPFEDIEQFMPKGRDGSSQPTAKKIKVSNYRLSNIQQISFDGSVYKVSDK